MKELLKKIESNPYNSYIYAYPHKKAYRVFEESIDLKKLWEKREPTGITLYIHIPFCMNKCGYCNLLSTTQFNECKIDRYVDKLIEEIESVKSFLELKEKEQPFSSVIFGGGTPTILKEEQLKKVLDNIKKILNIDFSKTFFSVEASPKTLTESKLKLLKAYHIDRISMGVQSFMEDELKSIYRYEGVEEIKRASNILFKEDIKIKNLDLIYGIPSQTLDTWEASLEKVISYQPEEIYIYPIYIRENTSLYDKNIRNQDLMIEMYNFATKMLEDNNYIQTSMRNFVRKDRKEQLFPQYSCQEKQMIGIGCGARSYISNVHYSRKYAVEPKNINQIIDDYLIETDLSHAKYGYILSVDEQKRRYILKSILKVSGLDIRDYKNKFHTSPLEEYEELRFLLKHKLLIKEDEKLYPSEKGLGYSDYIGPLFISDEVHEKMNTFIE
ncbi:MAG: STM4012 family radical SAM protein [Marinisporobacter sp.]|jgi:oxygen-independent coproporphyrinogen-3 oxidase|nr:STM4012 family radical SAM protein [Marinisporobacter sp.]